MSFQASRFRVHAGRPERLSRQTQLPLRVRWTYGWVLFGIMAAGAGLWALIFLAARALWMALAGH